MNIPVKPIDPSSKNWHGQLDLTYCNRQDQTIPISAYASSPFKIQRPFYPEGPEVCHSVILHTAGGIVGGDRLSLNLHLQPHTHTLITTAAAAKIYRSREESQQTIRIQVDDQACLEWFPQETIVFHEALHRQTLRVELAPTALWIGWELTRLGRSARGEQFLQGQWRSRTEVWRQGRPLWIDPQWIEGNETVFQSPHGLAGQPVVGSFAIVGRTVPPTLVQQARDLWEELNVTGDAGVTRLLEGMLCRYRGPSTTMARLWFTQVWNLVRRTYCDRPAHLPRIWPQ